MIVLDASAVIELLLATEAGGAVALRLAPPAETLHAPHLLDLEVTQVLRRYEAAGMLSVVRAREALTDFHDLEIERYEHAPLLARIWQLRNNATAYDAAYLALAEVLRAPLLTLDTKLASSPGHRAVVELVR